MKGSTIFALSRALVAFTVIMAWLTEAAIPANHYLSKKIIAKSQFLRRALHEDNKDERNQEDSGHDDHDQEDTGHDDHDHNDIDDLHDGTDIHGQPGATCPPL